MAHAPNSPVYSVLTERTYELVRKTISLREVGLTLLFLVFFLFIGCNMQQYKSWSWVPGSPALSLMVPCHPAHDARTVRELKTQEHAVTACAPCDMPRRSGGAGHAPPQPRLS
jgi:hypothetical protein